MHSKRVSAFLVVTGLMLLLAGAASLQLRLDAPEYALTALHPVVDIELEDAPPSAGRLRYFNAVLVNDGRQPVSIKGVRSTCGCTVPSGGVSNRPVNPGEQIEFPVTVTLPAYGKKVAELLVETNVEELSTTKITVRMAGRTLTPPYLNTQSLPIQLTTSEPGALVEHLLTVNAIESAAADPWITGFTTSDHPANVELISVSTAREIPGVDIIERRYDFLLRCVGPVDRDDVVAFQVMPETTRPSTKPVVPRSVRISLVADS